MSWMNSDGLFVKYGVEEADTAAGGAYNVDGDTKEVEVEVDWTELLSATDAIVGSVGQPGARGVQLPEGAIVEEVEVVVTEAFTSSGTIGSATFLLGTKLASDRSTEQDHNGFLTASATGTALALATLGSKTVVKVGSTGAGAALAVALAANGVLSASNSAHATHPYTAGTALVRIKYR